MFWELKESQAEVEVELQVETEITTEGLGQGPEIDEVGVETDIIEDGAEVEIGEDPEAEIVDEEAEVVEDPEAGEGAEVDLGTDVVMIQLITVDEEITNQGRFKFSKQKELISSDNFSIFQDCQLFLLCQLELMRKSLRRSEGPLLSWG